jgi:Phage integrase family
VIHNFNADGFEALYPRYRGGRPPTFTLHKWQAIKRVALSRARPITAVPFPPGAWPSWPTLWSPRGGAAPAAPATTKSLSLWMSQGQLYPADPPTVEEIIAVMRRAPDDRHGARLRALIVVLWRAGLRVQEALALGECDLDARRGSLLVRRGKGGRRREIGMDAWGWEQLSPWLVVRVELPAIAKLELSPPKALQESPLITNPAAGRACVAGCP